MLTDTVPTNSRRLFKPLLLLSVLLLPLLVGGPALANADPFETELGLTDVLQLIDLNHASAEQLTTLPQIGPVRAQAIISWREENGSFTDIEQLLEVRGIGPVLLARLQPLITLQPHQ